MIRDPRSKYFRDDSLWGEIGCFILCLFYLLPAIALYNYIGWWSLLAAAGFWLIVIVAMRTWRKYVRS